MKKNIALFIISMLLLSCSYSSRCGDGKVIEVKGRILLQGSEPHTNLIIKTEDGISYKIIGELEKKLRDNHQREVLVLLGCVRTKAKGPGFPTQFEVLKVVVPTQN